MSRIRIPVSSLCTSGRKDTVLAYMQQQIDWLVRMKREGTAKTYRSTMSSFRRFLQGTDVPFESLTPTLLERYEAHLLDAGLCRNTVAFYLRTLRTVYNRALAEGIPAPAKAFARVHTSYGRTARRAISPEQVRALRRLELPPGSSQARSRDLFLFSLYTRGMSFVDMAYLRKSDLRGGMLVYVRRKSHQRICIEWTNQMQELVDRYAASCAGTPYLLPIILRPADGTERRQFEQAQQSVNRHLKKLGRQIGLSMPLTTYVARHTWATTARSLNVPLPIISEGLGHDNDQTTLVYLASLDCSLVHQANQALIDFFEEE